MEKYEQLSVIGEGSYGIVMKCRHRETDQIVAIKKFLETEEDATIRRMALREIRMLKRLKHENLVTMIEVFRYRKRFYLVFEFLEGTVLDELEKMPEGLGEERCRERIYQVVRAINYCHSNHIIHRDVKPENVLVSSSGVVKLCDFGFARIISLNGEACTEYVATRWYRAPELLVGEPIYGQSVDIWAIGCLFAEMMTGDPFFPGESDIDQLYLIVKMLGKPCVRHQQLMSKSTQLRPMIKSPSRNDPSMNLYKKFPNWPLLATDFLIGCTKMDPQERLTAEELLRHTFFLHDKFPQRFLPALREKVNVEFSSPLLRKLKSEIIISTDKNKEEHRPRRLSNENNRWRLGFNEGPVKRKLNYEPSNDQIQERNLITLAKSSQRLNVLNNSNNNSNKGGQQHQQVLSKQASLQTKNLPTSKFKLTGASTEIQMLEKSLESLVKIHKCDENKEDNRPCSVHKDHSSTPLLPDSSTPSPFHSLHFGFGDYSRSPNIQNILHPSINNISFHKEPTKKSPNILQSLNPSSNTYGKMSQVPLLSNQRTQYLKKMDRNMVMENIFGQGDQISNSHGNTPSWLQSFGHYNGQKNSKKPDGSNNKLKSDDFSLPNLPGASISPNKTKKKSMPQLELPMSTEVSPAYRYQKAKRKRNILDISLPLTVNENGIALSKTGV